MLRESIQCDCTALSCPKVQIKAMGCTFGLADSDQRSFNLCNERDIDAPLMWYGQKPEQVVVVEEWESPSGIFSGWICRDLGHHWELKLWSAGFRCKRSSICLNS